MEYNTFMATIQIVLAAIQLRLNYHKKNLKRTQQDGLVSLENLGEAIRTLEYALSETIAFIGKRKSNTESNPRLAFLWAEASKSISKIQDGADLADLTFEKHLYWTNPEFYNTQSENKLNRISLENVLVQLRTLRSGYDKIQGRIN